MNLDLNYNFAKSDKVIGDSTLEFPDAGNTIQEISARVEYVPLTHFAVDLTLPFQAIKYTGNKVLYPHPGGGSYDDGATHTTLTDLRANARYQILEDPIAISPLIGVSLPLADYETVGAAVAGRHLKQLHLGVAAGAIIGEHAYAHAMYTFSLVERYDRTAETERYGQNHSDATLTFGYKLLSDRLDISLEASGRITHGGVNFTEFAMLSPGEQMFHDAYLREEIVLVGPGVGYQITNTLAANIAGRLFVTGKNTQNASVIGLGLSWSAL